MSGRFHHPASTSSRRGASAAPSIPLWTAGVASLLTVGLAFLTAAAATLTATASTPVPTTRTPWVSIDQRASHNGTYGAEVIDSPGVDIGTRNAWTMELHAGGQTRVTDAVIEVYAWMPENGIRSPVAARASHLGNGLYRLEDLYFSEAGWWNVAMIVEGSQGTDSLAFNIVLP